MKGLLFDGRLPKGWQKLPLGDAVDFIGGSQPSKSTFTYEPGEDRVRLVQIRDFRTDKFLTYIPKNLAKRPFTEDDVMIGRYGPPVFQILRGLSGSYNVALMKAAPKKDMVPDFLFRLLSAPKLHGFIVSNSTRTAGQSGVNLKLLNNIEIPLPPLAEQKRLAAILDAADALRAKRQQALAHLDDLLQSTFLTLFGDPVTNPMGWEKVAVVELCEDPTDARCGPFGTQLLQNEFTESGVPLWGIKHVNSGFKLKTHEYVSEEKAKDLANYDLIAGDLVMTRKGTIGNCHIYPDDFPKAIMHSDLLRLRLSPNKANAQFIASQFTYSQSIRKQLEIMSPGAVMLGINVSKLKKLKIESPPLPLQQRFAAIVEKIEAQKARHRAHLAELDTLFASLQSRAFSGEL